MITEAIDYLGNPIKLGQRRLRVHVFSHNKQFKRITVKRIDFTRNGDIIGIITDGNSKVGWTYPRRLLIETSITVKI